MKRQSKQWFLALGLFSMCVVSLAPALAARDDLNLTALAMHRETGRDIYLGALLARDPLETPADISGADDERAMEFRIVARRTSIRSVLGGILLQAELASGAPPPPATVDFANAIMSSVQGSLYTGDSFTLWRSAGGDTAATVNGLEMAHTAAPGVFDYFLSGWIGERGAATAFRDSLLSADIDVDLRADYAATRPSAERVAAVSTWVASPAPVAPEPVAPEPVAPEPAAPKPAAPEPAAPKPAAPEQAAKQQVAAGSTSPAVEKAAATNIAPATNGAVTEDRVAAASAAAASAAAASAAASTAVDGGDTGDEVATDPAQPPGEALAPATPSIAMARIKPVLRETSPAQALAEETAPEDPYGVAALSVIEYSQRLAAFNSMVFRMVNSKIRYPRAAIRRGIQGNLELDVTLDSDGNLQRVAVGRSSGHGMLDDSAVTAAERAFKEPLEKPVDKVALAEYNSGERNRLVIPVPVNFMLTE
ncbi:energy transducer TonB [Parahaliea mediterranea]|uniref:Energy transducer TonB n=1 Tax=Parahaliea mediterranea TaxID=651086 RepID=A0A939IML4_9GAMM|nr:energy transducer TonB [Parahaliea mediterranea]MBN7797132.1 energy transducer TonB [Parahaliea mediterranea]